MSVTDVTEISAGRAGSMDQKYKREYTRVFLVGTNSAATTSLEVRLATGIPRIYDGYATTTESDLGARVYQISERQLEDPYYWEVQVDYSTMTGDEVKQAENPLARPSEIEFSFRSERKPATKTTDNEPIDNSAKEPFDPPPEMDDSRPVITITRNEAGFDPNIAVLYQDAINSDTWFGLAPHVAKMSGIRARSMKENNLLFWQVTYEIHIRWNTWDLSILDQGYRKVILDELVQIVDQFGQPISQPALLDGGGNTLPTGEDPVYLSFEIYREQPFGPLNLL